MAPALKWVAGYAAAFAVVGVAVTGMGKLRHEPGGESWRRLSAISREIGLAVGELAQTERQQLARQLATDPTVAPVTLQAELSDTVRQTALRELSSEAALLGRTKVPVRVALVQPVLRRNPSWNAAEAFYGARAELHAERAPMPYCVMLNLADASGRRGPLSLPARWTSSDGLPVTNATGPCRYWAKYGAPGEQVEQWLRSGAYHFADGKAEWLEPAAPAARRQFAGPGIETELFAAAARRCISGDTADCEAKFLQVGKVVDRFDRNAAFYAASAAVPRRIADYVRVPYPPFIFGRGDAALLAHLERDFGPERFARFWTSNAAVRTAFTEAFGEEPGSWVARWAADHFGPATAGPRVGAMTTLLSLLTIGIVTALAVAAAQRRRIA